MRTEILVDFLRRKRGWDGCILRSIVVVTHSLERVYHVSTTYHKCLVIVNNVAKRTHFSYSFKELAQEEAHVSSTDLIERVWSVNFDHIIMIDS